MLKRGEIVAWSLEGMSLHTSQLRKPIVTPSHDHNKPPSHLLSTPPPPERSQVTHWKGSSKKQPPAISSSSLGAVAEGTVSRKASKDFCPFHTFFSKFSVAEYLGMGTSTNAKKKKKVFMNNGTFQIHLVSETFFSFLTAANYIACLSENWFYPEAHSALKFLHW